MINSNSSSVVSQLPPSGGAGSSGNKPGNLSVNGENRSVSQIQQQEGIPNPLKDLALTVYYVALGVIAIGAFSAALFCPLAGFVAVPIAKLLVTGLLAHFALCHGGPSISTPPGQIFASLFGGSDKVDNRDNDKLDNQGSANLLDIDDPSQRSNAKEPLRPVSTTPPSPPPRKNAPSLIDVSSPVVDHPINSPVVNPPVDWFSASTPPIPMPTTSPALTPTTPVLTSASSVPAVTSVIDSSLHPSLIINPPSPSKSASALSPTPQEKPLQNDGIDPIVDYPEQDHGFFYRMLNYWRKHPSHEKAKEEQKSSPKVNATFSDKGKREAEVSSTSTPTSTLSTSGIFSALFDRLPSFFSEREQIFKVPRPDRYRDNPETTVWPTSEGIRRESARIIRTLRPVDVDEEQSKILEKALEKEKEKGVIDKGISFVKKELSDVFLGEAGRRLLDDEDDDEFNIEMDPISDDEFGSFVEDYIDDENHDWSPPKREPPLYF